MSFLELVRSTRKQLKKTNIKVTYPDGNIFLEDRNSQNATNIKERSCGFVVDIKPDFMPNEILENKLYLGSQDCIILENIKTYNITHILSIGIETPAFEQTNCVKTKFIPCLDIPETDLKPILEESIDFICEVFRLNGKIIVHCNAGVSRSSSVVMAYLMKKLGYSFDVALEFVKHKRPCIQPNRGFIEQLRRFE